MDDAQRFADFAQIGADWLWETDSVDRYSYFSVAVTRAGIDLANRLGLRRRDVATSGDENFVRIDALEAIMARREPFRDFLFQARAGKAGDGRWCTIGGNPRYDAAGAFLGYRGVGRDITEQVEAQRALETKIRALDAILRAIPDGVQVIDKNNKTLAVNSQVYEIMGIPDRSAAAGSEGTFQSILDMAKRGEYGPGDPEALAQERVGFALKAVQERQTINYERRLTTGRWMEARLRALDDGGFLSLYRDITEAKQRAAEQERQSKLLEAIATNMDGGLAVFDKDGLLSAWNDRFADLVGIERSMIKQGATLRDLLISQARGGEFGPCDPEAEADRRLATFHGGRPAVSERQRPNGRIVELRRNPIPGGGSVTIYIDVTTRKQAEQAVQDLNATLERLIAERTVALADSERFQRSIIANVPGMVYRCRNDRDWTMQFVSEGCRDLLGIAPEDLTGGRVIYNDLVHPHEREALWLKVQADFETGQAFELEYRVRHADGTWRWVWDRANAIRSPDGKVIGLEGLILNINARKVAEQEGSRARDNLVDAIDSLNHNLILYDRDDRLVLFTRHIYEQYPRADEYFVVGHTFEQIFRQAMARGEASVPPGMSAEQFIAERIARHNAADGTVITRHLVDGRIMHISEHRAQSGGIVAIGRDVTHQLKIEQQLREAQRMDAIGRLTGGLAHDLNNYLAVIMGNLDLLAGRMHVDPEVPKLIEGAVGGTMRGAELTRSLLAFSRRQPLAPKVLDIGERVKGVVQLLRRTIGEKVVVDIDIASSLWPVKIDGAQLDSCIVNLANNARDAMSGGGRIAISVRNAMDEPDSTLPPEQVLIEFRDFGTGMAPETLAQAFEPFFTTKGAGHGTGLGLSMVYGFVHQSGGVVRMQSEPGKGTVVRIFLPRTLQAAPAGKSALHEDAPHGSERILVVEDNDLVRAIAVEQLISLGYDTVEADSGDAALMLLERNGRAFDLVFTDLVMPGRIDGYELAELVRQRWPELTVLMTSGYTGDFTGKAEEKTFNANMLRKPYRRADLAAAIRATLNGGAGEGISDSGATT